MRFLRKYWPIFFILLLWFVFSASYFIKHTIPYPADYQVNNFHPWNGYMKFLGSVKNGAMPDVVDEIYPWRHLTIEELKNGSVPLWNPYSFSGTPHLANYQASVFSPFNILFSFLPFIDAWSLLIIFQPLITGLSMYLFMKKLRVSDVGSVISSVACMFCGFIVVWMEYGTLAMSIAFLPLALFAIESYLQKKNIRSLVLLFITCPLSLFSGHFQTSIYFVLFVMVYGLFRALETKKYKHIFFCGVVFFLGICFCAIQILPSIELYRQSVRSGIFRKSGGIPFFYLVNLFAPDYFGNPVTRNDWFGYYAEWASFIGIIPLFLSFTTFLKIKNKTILFFAITALCSLVLSLDSPLTSALANLKIPVLSTSGPSRIIVLTSFSLTILAGFGMDILIEAVRKKSYKKLILPLFFVSFLLFAAFVGPLIFHMPSDKRSIAYHNLLLPSFFILCLSFIISINWMFHGKKVLRLSLVLLILLISIDSIHFAGKWMPFEKLSDVFPTLPVIKEMQKNVGNNRAFGNFGAYIDTYYHIPSIEGYDPLYSQRYGEFIESAKNGTFEEAQRSVVKLNRNGLYTNRVLDLLGVSVIYHPVFDTNKPWALPVWKDPSRFVRFFQDERFALYKNTKALPRLTLFYDYIVKKDKNILATFYSNAFDFRKKLILEETTQFPIKSGIGSINTISYESTEIKASVMTNEEALLFLSDAYYPGWNAYVDGKKVKIFRADYAFRAIEISPGKHRIEFRYQPKSLDLGIAISAVSIMFMGIFCFWVKKEKEA